MWFVLKGDSSYQKDREISVWKEAVPKMIDARAWVWVVGLSVGKGRLSNGSYQGLVIMAEKR